MKRALFLLFSVVFIAGFASGTSIDEENITVDLQDETVDAEIYFDDLTSSSFTYVTNHPVNNYNVEIEGQRVDCEFEELAIGGEISCPTDYRQNFTVDLEYETSGLTNSQNSVNFFRYSQSIYRPIENYNIKVILPEGTGLIDQTNISTPVIEPESGVVGSEGRRIHVEWSISPSLGETVSFQAAYEQLSPNYRMVIVVIASILLIAGLFRFYLRQRSKSESSNIIESLPEDEQDVLSILRENSDMLQKDIVDESEYSKAKISGVISSLEEKEIIEKEKEGRSNRIYVKEEFLN